MRVASIGTPTWIGLKDSSGNRNNFMWSDGSSLNFINWASNNPNYNEPGEACVASLSQDNREGQWNDVDCTTIKPYICKKAKDCETYTTRNTDYDYYYRYHPSPLPSNRVEFEVQATNDVHVALTSSNTGQGEMYEIVIGGWGNTQSAIRRCMQCNNEVEVQTIDILSGTEFRGFWINYDSTGLISVGKYGEGFSFMEWTDPNPFQVNYVGYSTGFGSQGEFRFCSLDAGSSGTVNPGPTPAFDSRCGSGWEFDSSTGNCYLFKPTDYKTWFDAELECNKGGGNLVSISGLPEMSYINGRMVYVTESRLWIGATDASREGGWKWSDDSAFRYLNWNTGEPNNVGEAGEHCAEMYVSTGTWNDIDCDQSMGYICKKNGYLVDHFNVFHSMHLDGYDNLQLTNIFPEDCARQCVQQTGFTCRSFEYNTETMECSLSDASTVYSGAVMSYKENSDYYERPVGEQCPSGWEMNLGKCFYFNKYAEKTWDESRAACQADGGDLVMIKDSETENWLTTRVVALEGSYWIGLHDLSNEGDFEWVDGSKLVDVGFSRWDLRQPDNAGAEGEDCVEMWTSGLWNDQTCDDTTGYICGQETVYDVPYEEVPATLAPIYRCPSGWHTYGDNCYMIQLSEGSWQDARDQCRAMGGELASIHDNLENQFIAALVIQTGVTGPLTHFWIGLNDLRVSLTFEWVDGSDVLFTKWSDNEPNNFIGADEDCVEMDGAGAWNDERCSMINPSVCKMSKKIIEGTIAPVTSSGCELGWTPYGGSCYGVPGKVASSWSNAQAACRTSGAKLASIKDRFEQTVVSSILSQENGNPIWIGLSDVDTPGEYEWSDGTAVTYTHWDYQQPKQNDGNCVAATSGLVAGLWQVNDCGSRYNYLCEKVREGFTAPPIVTDPLNPTTPNDNNCAQDWIGYGNRCFRVYDYGFSTVNLRSWGDARSFCMAVGGDLASFHSTAEEDYIVQRGGYKDNGFWIGLHDRSIESGFEWSDGTVLDYVNWNNGEPNNANTQGEDCAEMFFNGRGWNDIDCGNLQSWICQIERGKVPSNPPNAVSPSSPSYTPCPLAEDWILEGYYCYYLSAGANLRLSWNDANAWCMENDGYLASIHGRDEQDRLIYYAQSYTYTSHWIGIREYDISGTYVWADGTPLDFENWNTGEPNDANGEEQCGEMYAANGLWNDLNCENEVTFVCKRPFRAIIPATYPPTPTPTGYCPSDWVQYGSRCYKIYGESYDDRRNWYQARESCQAEGADLIKIHSQEIQSFVVTQMKEVQFELYIGLSDISVNEQFRWVDGSYVDYTNWNSREPNEAGGEEDCVELTWQEHVVGKWNDVNCEGVRGFICQKNVDESNPMPPPVESDCEDGYVPYYESCFKVLTSQTNFQTAGATCQSDGYDLASISDIYEQSFVETLMYSGGGNPLWIGMNQDQISGEYKWADGWPTYYTNWGYREPSQGSDEGCVVISSNGTWDDTSCGSNYGAVCKYTSLPKPTFPPDTPGSCPTDWLTYGNDCFLIRASSLDLSSFPEAQYICRTYGAQLASIHSSVENQLIQNTIATTSTDVWIGMDRELNGAYKWVDDTSVNYLNWAENEPSYTAGDIEETCVEMYPNNGMWNDRECLQKQGFVCRAPKNNLDPSVPSVVTEPAATTKATQQSPEKQTGVSAGGIVGIIIGVLAAVLLAALVIFFVLTCSREPAVAKDPGLPPSVGFDNALYKSNDKDTTVQIGSTELGDMDA